MTGRKADSTVLNCRGRGGEGRGGSTINWVISGCSFQTFTKSSFVNQTHKFCFVIRPLSNFVNLLWMRKEIRFLCIFTEYAITLKSKRSNLQLLKLKIKNMCTQYSEHLDCYTVQAFTLTQNQIKTISRFVHTKPLQSEKKLMKALRTSNYYVITK